MQVISTVPTAKLPSLRHLTCCGKKDLDIDDVDMEDDDPVGDGRGQILWVRGLTRLQQQVGGLLSTTVLCLLLLANCYCMQMSAHSIYMCVTAHSFSLLMSAHSFFAFVCKQIFYAYVCSFSFCRLWNVASTVDAVCVLLRACVMPDCHRSTVKCVSMVFPLPPTLSLPVLTLCV